MTRTTTTTFQWNKFIPDPPFLFAGTVGGPSVMLLVTPLRNALTLAASDTKSDVRQIYRQVFQRGGWVGGVYTLIPSIPQFCVIGPLFHVWKDIFGNAQSAVLATAGCETLLAYGAETRNAQMAGSIRGKLHNPMIPFGPGVALHFTRNALAMSGLRVLSDPCRGAFRSAIDTFGIEVDDNVQHITSDLVANLIASAVSMPLHQLYGFTVVNAGNRDLLQPKPSLSDRIRESRAFLRRQFLVPGTNQMSRIAWRDIVLRCSYNATIYTIFGCIERASVNLFQQRGWS